MSDSLLQTFLHYGTNAQRLAFTPNPPAAPEQPSYLWYETDTDTVWAYTTGWHQITGSGTGGINQLTGDVTAGPGTGSQATTIGALKIATGMIQASAVTLAKIQNAAANSKLLGSGASGSGSAYTELSLGSGLTMSGTTLSASSGVATRAITFDIDGGGSAITTSAAADVFVPYACTITAVHLAADQSGSVQLDIKKCAFGSFPASLASIVASDPPALSSAQTSVDTTLTGWTTSISAGDMLRFTVTSVSTIERLNCVLTVTV